MTAVELTGVFLGEGSSDTPLADIVETLFLHRHFSLRLSRPDLSRLPIDQQRTSIEDKLRQTAQLLSGKLDMVVVHRDADNAGPIARRQEIMAACARRVIADHSIPVVPVRLTEAWLLLDEAAIRRVAGNPNGRAQLGLPSLAEVERRADPKAILREALATASETTGRRRETVRRRFGQHRRQLLERLDIAGPINGLSSWKGLLSEIDSVATQLRGR